MLGIHGPKTGVGACMEKPCVRIACIHTNHKVIENGGWALAPKWVLTRETTAHELTQTAFVHIIISTFVCDVAEWCAL